MQYLDNDMNELFNKAGNDYPLRTDVPDFTSLAAKIDPPVETPTASKKWRYLLLLLLAGTGMLLMQENKNEPLKATNKNESSSTANGNTSQNDEKKNYQAFEKPGASTESIRDQNIKLNTGAVMTTAATPDANSRIRERRDIINISAQSSERNNRLISSEYNDNNVNRRKREGFKLKTDKSQYKKPIISFPNLQNEPASNTELKKTKRQPSIYLGLAVGPDLSTIKYQSVKNIGFSIGIAGGYTFAKRWSLETGLIYNTKKYFTDGKYFDKTKSGIPSTTHIETLDGTCNMIEIPVSLRYDFSAGRNGLFATIGGTSYFMSREKYTYDAYASGSSYEGHRSYKNSGNHIFSNMQISIGYHRALSDKLKLRIEPYIKLPVRDIGIGNLPVTSGGIYFSVMQSIK